MRYLVSYNPDKNGDGVQEDLIIHTGDIEGFLMELIIWQGT